MKFWILTSLTLFMLSCLLSPAAVLSAGFEPYRVEDKTNFSLTDLKGKTQSLSDYRGKVVLINFWASWCIPCIMEMPELTQLKQHMDSQPFAGPLFEILALNVGERENRVKQFTKRINYTLPVLLDTSSKVFNAWSIEIMPSSFLIDTRGMVRYRALGNPGWDNEQTLSLIEKLIKETE